MCNVEKISKEQVFIMNFFVMLFMKQAVQYPSGLHEIWIFIAFHP